MARRCTVCEHPKRRHIERAFMCGKTYRQIVERYAIEQSSLSRHVKHIARRLLHERRAVDAAQTQDLTKVAAEALAASKAILRAAQVARNGSLALGAVAALQRHVELMAKIEGKIREQVVVNVLVSTEWKALEDGLFGVLERHPEARNDVAKFLLSIETGTRALSG